MNKKRRSVPGIRHYDGPAGGWGALKATAIAVRTQMDTLDAPATLLRTNQPDGFDCPGCAWPDKEHKSTFQFCENGAKAVTWEATSKRVTPAFLVAARSREIHENAPHQPGAHRKKMGAVLPVHLFEIDQPQVCFVDERGRLKRVAWPLRRHLSPRQPSQLLVDDRHELLQRGLVAVVPSGEETRHVMAGRIGHGDRPRIRREKRILQHDPAHDSPL